MDSSLSSATDSEVLERFLERRDEGAFAELVHRYGPVVRAVCRRALGDSPDADDVFQTVFLILARKAGTLRNAALLAPWLHTVTVRAAERARLLARRRQARERLVTSMPEPFYVPPPAPGDWLPLLDAEIQRLPARLRVPLVLCELEGKSRAETARLLSLNEGTLSSRLARGRALLRKRLQRSGTIVAGAGLTAAFAYWGEVLPPQLLLATTKGALSGTTSASVAALTQGVLKVMLIAKLRIALVVVLTFGVVSGILVSARYATVRGGEGEGARTDKEMLQGDWEVTSAQLGGKEPEGEEGDRIKKQKIVIKGDKVTAREEAEYTLDPGKKPKEIDVKVEQGPAQERGTWRGIYEIKGDELTLCMALPNQERPKDFVSKEGERVMLMKLKRAK